MGNDPNKKNEARLKREQMQAAAAARERRSRAIQLLAAGVFAVVVVVVLVVLLGGNKDQGPKGLGQGGGLKGTAETKKLLEGIPQDGFTLGNASAKVQILEFMDLQCPYCREHAIDDQPKVINELVRTGKAKYRLLPLGFLGEDSAAGRAVMARLADKDKAWQFANLFFWNQGTENTGYVTPDFLQEVAVAAGGATDDASSRVPTGSGVEATEKVDALQKTLLPGGPSTPTFAIGLSSQKLEDYDVLDLRQSNATASQQIITAVNELTKKSGV